MSYEFDGRRETEDRKICALICDYQREIFCDPELVEGQREIFSG